MQVILTNLSNKLFEASRNRLNDSARRFGINTILSYDFSEIRNSVFFKDNYRILSQPKGLGYWLWKPYIILEAFKQIEEGDLVIYSDCGIEIIAGLEPLLNLSEQRDIVLFANSNYTNKIWTKRDCFVLMGCDEEKYWNGIHCDAAFGIFKKNRNTKAFLNEWLQYGGNENIIADLPNISGAENFPEFIEHRRDQSILSLLAIKHGIEFYRMPTQFGNHYKSPAYRVAGEFNCVNQGNQAPLNYYAEKFFDNSNYFQLLSHHRNKDKADNNTEEPLIIKKYNRLMKLKTFIRKGIKTMIGASNKTAKPYQNPYQKKSYSQCGEDLIVQYIFRLRGINHPTYIDIGANDPYFLSNTALFYENGCKGINIEANPALYQKFIIARPNDINLNVGVGSKEEELDFYVMTDDTLSSFSKEECDAMVSHGKALQEVIKIKLDTVTNILEKHFNGQFPDFMSLDVEGMDFQILKSIDFDKHCPKIICVEAAEYSPIGAGARRNELIDFLVGKGYYEYANTNLNAILVKKEFWFI